VEKRGARSGACAADQEKTGGSVKGGKQTESGTAGKKRRVRLRLEKAPLSEKQEGARKGLQRGGRGRAHQESGSSLITF